MLEATSTINITMVDAHAVCEECMACRKIHPKTSAACPGQTGGFSTFLCERVREGIRRKAEEQAKMNIGKSYHNLLDVHNECAECQVCRHIHPKTSSKCPGQTGQFSDFTCETLRRSKDNKERLLH